MTKVHIRVDLKTGQGYFPREIRRAGFHGEIAGYLNALACLLVKPGATLIEVERSLKVILGDVGLRKDREENVHKKVEDPEHFKLPERQVVIQGGLHPIFFKYTRAWLSEVTRYSKGYLCRVATGKIPVSQSFMKRAALALGETPEALFLLEDAEESQQP